jgi:twitching motility protein PilT
MLSTSLRGVVSQQLIKRADGSGRVAALEILINTSGCANLIRQGKLDQLENAMQMGAQYGMRTMDSAIQALLDAGVISGADAYRKAINKAKFEAFKESAEGHAAPAKPAAAKPAPKPAPSPLAKAPA